MSGVYIKGMELPTGCGKCACGAYGVCDATTPKKLLDKHYRWSADERPDWCPLLLIPPHGRLIDADALLKDDSRKYDMYRGSNGRDTTLDDACRRAIQWTIEDAPTIIPADPEKEATKV